MPFYFAHKQLLKSPGAHSSYIAYYIRDQMTSKMI